MLLWISLALIMIAIALGFLMEKIKSFKICEVIGFISGINILVGIFGLIISGIMALVIFFGCYNADELSNIKNKVTETHSVASAKMETNTVYCIQELSNDNYVGQEYDLSDVTITYVKNTAPKIETVEYTGVESYPWIIPLVKEKHSTKYHLYVPIKQSSEFDVYGSTQN